MSFILRVPAHPAGGLTDNWTGEFVGTLNFAPDYYAFSVSHDDGARMFVDLNGDGNVNLSNEDRGYSPGKGNDLWGCSGKHLPERDTEKVELLLRGDSGDADIRVAWAPVATACNPSAPSNLNVFRRPGHR
ncbi:MAG: hypothetical protein U0703_11915 [Anaerolineae bacterium]